MEEKKPRAKKIRAKDLVKLRVKGPEEQVQQLMDILRPLLEQQLEVIEDKGGYRIGRTVRTASGGPDAIAEAHAQVPLKAIIALLNTQQPSTPK